MAFIFVILQEAVTGKGVIQGITEGDPLFIVGLAVTAASIVALSVLLAIKGDDNYVDKDLGLK